MLILITLQSKKKVEQYFFPLLMSEVAPTFVYFPNLLLDEFLAFMLFCFPVSFKWKFFNSLKCCNFQSICMLLFFSMEVQLFS